MLLLNNKKDFLSMEFKELFDSEIKLHCIKNLYADKREILQSWPKEKLNNILKTLEEDKNLLYVNRDVEDLFLYYLLKDNLISIVGETKLQQLNFIYDDYVKNN